MPPRFAYWTIILEGKPTAFRAQHAEELLPTFKQLQSRHPDAVLKWFARGRLWESPQEAIEAQRRGRERRPAEWRPGGEHRDPRARFKVPRDVKRKRFAAKLRRDGPEGHLPERGTPPESAPAVPGRPRENAARERRNRPAPRHESRRPEQRDERGKKSSRPPAAGGRPSFRPKSGGPAGRRFGPKPGGRGPGKGKGGNGGGGRSR